MMDNERQLRQKLADAWAAHYLERQARWEANKALVSLNQTVDRLRDELEKARQAAGLLAARAGELLAENGQLRDELEKARVKLADKLTCFAETREDYTLMRKMGEDNLEELRQAMVHTMAKVTLATLQRLWGHPDAFDECDGLAGLPVEFF